MTRYKKYQDWFGSIDFEKKRPLKELVPITIVCLGIIGAAALTLSRCTEPVPVYKSHYSQKELFTIRELREQNFRNPIELGIAINKTKNPKLMAAIALKESNGDLKAIGDGGASKGAFQVKEKHWGKVGQTATEQALQAERVLEDLMGSNPRGSLRSILARYNGGNRPPKRAYRYATDVLKIKKGIDL